MSSGDVLNWCDFCGKNSDFVEVLVATPNGKIHICDECINVCVDVLRTQQPAPTDKSGPRADRP
jgi:ATP-dependent protease Clp ATPase subunit